MQTMKKQFFFFFSICACLNKNIAAISVADISILSVYSAVYGPRLTILSLVCGKGGALIVWTDSTHFGLLQVLADL